MKLNSFLKTHAVAIAAVVFAGGVMSFKTMEKKAATTYYYNSSSTAPGAFATDGNWSTSNNLESCSEEGNRPCRLIVQDNTTLHDMINGKINSAVLAISVDRKP